MRAETTGSRRAWGVEQGVQAGLGYGTGVMGGHVFRGARGVRLGGEGCPPRDPGDDG